VRRNRTKSRIAGLSTVQISRGFGICVSCFHESALVCIHRCAACDGEVCALCVVNLITITSEEQLCPGCAADEQNTSD
jgi:hypothetical protein